MIDRTQQYLRSRTSEGCTNHCDAWQRFYQLYDRLILRFIVACGCPVAAIDDCKQDIWKEIILHLPNFEYNPRRCRFRTWLYRVTRSVVTDCHRRMRKQSVERPLSRRCLELLWQRHGDPIVELQRREDTEFVRDLLARLKCELSAINYEVFCLRTVQGGSVAETAEQLRLPPEAVRSRDFRARRVFRRLGLPSAKQGG